jgi:hypothetical protein
MPHGAAIKLRLRLITDTLDLTTVRSLIPIDGNRL